LNPAKIVERVGKILSPGIIILLFALLVMALVKPMGSFEAPQEAYANGAFVKGFIEGYNTMDALASLVFGIIVINAIRSLGVTSKREILSTTVKTGVVAVSLLAIIYIGITYLGATSTGRFGLFDTGGPVLSSASSYYFGTFGSILLAILITLACLTTSIGLITACGEYFHTLLPKISYKVFVIFFSIFSFTVANFGLANIITFSIPVLMFLYPLAITLMLLTFLSPLFNHSRLVYAAATFVAFLVSIIDGFTTLCGSLGIEYFGWLQAIVGFYGQVLPLYNQGLGWLIPVLITIVVTGIVSRLQKVRTIEVH
jgi:branched-chain amino acid:cation transporter, LIVCS family